MLFDQALGFAGTAMEPWSPDPNRKAPTVGAPFSDVQTVVLELEWVMRGFYRLSPEDFARAMRHLLALANVTVEDWERVDRALESHL